MSTHAMLNPAFLTVTGIDARTDMDRARRLALRYPLEFGVLISSNSVTQPGRISTGMRRRMFGAEQRHLVCPSVLMFVASMHDKLSMRVVALWMVN